MGVVSDYLRSAIEREVDRQGIVVWLDPEGHYESLAADLRLPDTIVARYGGSFFALRHEIEPLMGGAEPPRLVIYVPMAPDAGADALCEAQAAGVTMAPGEQPPARNTRLAVVARNALKAHLGAQSVAAVERQIEEGRLTLAELDDLADKGIARGVVSLVFGTDSPEQIGLAFLSDTGRDEQIVQRSALPELRELLDRTFGLPASEPDSPEAYRSRLTRHVLCTDLVAHFAGPPPERLASLHLPTEGAALEACLSLATSWRARRDLQESYARQAREVAASAGMGELSFTTVNSRNVETFREVEVALQGDVEQALLAAPSEELVELASRRQSSFWATQDASVQAEWALAAVAGRLLLEAGRVEEESRQADSDPGAFLRAYTEGDRPWCLLDCHHRHLERQWHGFEQMPAETDTPLWRLVSAARNLYTSVSSALAERFLRAYEAASFRVEGAVNQREVYARWVVPAIGHGKTAYLLVDALRFEMGRELTVALGEAMDCELRWAIGAAPGVTQVGMAALVLPPEVEPELVAADAGDLAVRARDVTLSDRKSRLAYLASHAGVEMCDLKLEDLLPAPTRGTRERIARAGLVVLTSQEIDALCEGDNIHLARRVMDDILRELARAVRILVGLGVENVIIAADHGYLFGEQIAEADKIEAPGGATHSLHRRVWVGHGGASHPSYLRAKVGAMGLAGDLDIAVPWSTGCFKVRGGARAYFHGGLSLQECVIPVITAHGDKAAPETAGGALTWTLTGGSPKVTTRFFSVTIEGRTSQLFDIVAPTVRIELRDGAKTISQTVSASYGLATGTGRVKLRCTEADPKAIESNTVALMLAEDPQGATVSVHLMDAATDVELARLCEVPVEISI